MSSPTLLCESFDNSLGAFSGVQPIRYKSGLWLEASTTNVLANPMSGNGFTGYTSVAETMEVVSTPSPLPDGLADLVTSCWALTPTSSHVPYGAIFNKSNQTYTTDLYAASVYVWIPSVFTPTEVCVVSSAFVGGQTELVLADMSVRDDWQRIVDVNFKPISGDVVGQVAVSLYTGSWEASEAVYVAAMQIELGAVSTSFTAGSLGLGYAWSSTAHASTSTRAASSASIATANHIAPSSGSIAFRVTPQIETGLEELWGETGTKGVGTDHLRWGRDATKHLYMEWSSNNAAYQRITSTETLDALTQYFCYLDWDGTAIRLQVGQGAMQSGSRDAVSGSWGAGDLVLKAE